MEFNAILTVDTYKTYHIISPSDYSQHRIIFQKTTSSFPEKVPKKIEYFRFFFNIPWPPVKVGVIHSYFSITDNVTDAGAFKFNERFEPCLFSPKHVKIAPLILLKLNALNKPKVLFLKYTTAPYLTIFFSQRMSLSKHKK